MAKKIDNKKQEKPANNIVELREQIKKTQEELFQLRLEHSQGKLKNTSVLPLKRKEIAKLLTTLRAIELTQ